jgi:hypothetical protein
MFIIKNVDWQIVKDAQTVDEYIIKTIFARLNKTLKFGP